MVSQRLLRRLCDCADPPPAASQKSKSIDEAAEVHTAQQALDAACELAASRQPRGCPACQGTGYRGRLVVAEMLQTSHPQIAEAVLSRAAPAKLAECAREAGMVTLWQQALAAVDQGQTSTAEVRRVFGC